MAYIDTVSNYQGYMPSPTLAPIVTLPGVGIQVDASGNVVGSDENPSIIPSLGYSVSPWNAGMSSVAGGGGETGVQGWLEKNKNLVYIAVGAFVLMAVLRK